MNNETESSSLITITPNFSFKIPNGHKVKKYYYGTYPDRRHRKGKVVEIVYSGGESSSCFIHVYNKGKLHNEHGPAHVDYYIFQNTSLTQNFKLGYLNIVYKQNGLTHREDGPAVIRYVGTPEGWKLSYNNSLEWYFFGNIIPELCGIDSKISKENFLMYCLKYSI